MSTARAISGLAWGSGLRQQLRLAPLFLSLVLADGLGRRRHAPPLRRSLPQWRPGIAVVIPERGAPELLASALQSVVAALAQLGEPTQLVVVINGSPRRDYQALLARYPEVEVVHSREPLGFSRAVGRGLQRVRYDWTFLMNNDMTLDPAALRELCSRRACDVFAVASQIFQHGAELRREETGFTDWYDDGNGVQLFHADPGSGSEVREHLCASGGAALFRTDPLRKYARGSQCYDPFYWEDVEWGVRARQDGLRVLFCPDSRAWHRRRATTSRFYAAAEVERIVTRNRLLFDARNAITDHGAQQLMRRVCDLAYDSQRGLAPLTLAARVFRQRLRARRRRPPSLPPALQPDRPVIELTPSYCFKLRSTTTAAPRRPRLLMVTPFCVFPPRHGGARRIDGLLRYLRRDFDIVLVSDESTLYDPRSFVYFDGLHAVHLVQRPRDDPSAAADLGGRIRTHCHERLGSAVSEALRRYQPDLVQVEHVELAALSRYRGPGQRWVLSLHDAFDRSDFHDPGTAARVEQHVRETYDAVTVCSAEDGRMIDHARKFCVPNGAEMATDYVASHSSSMLFMGPFRYAQNLDGIRRFLCTVYPAVKDAVPVAAVHVLGGDGAKAATAGDPVFAQPGVGVCDHRDDVRRLLAESALTLNPLRGIRGSSIKVIESLAAGRVCVSTEDGARGFVSAGLAGLVVVDDVPDMAAPIIDLLGNAKRRHLLESPRPQVLAPYAWQRSAGIQGDLYRDLLGLPGG